MSVYINYRSLYTIGVCCACQILQRVSGKRYLFATAGLRFDRRLTLPCKLTVSTDSSEQFCARTGPRNECRHDCCVLLQKCTSGTSVRLIRQFPLESVGNSCLRVTTRARSFAKNIKISSERESALFSLSLFKSISINPSLKVSISLIKF